MNDTVSPPRHRVFLLRIHPTFTSARIIYKSLRLLLPGESFGRSSQSALSLSTRIEKPLSSTSLIKTSPKGEKEKHNNSDFPRANMMANKTNRTIMSVYPLVSESTMIITNIIIRCSYWKTYHVDIVLQRRRQKKLLHSTHGGIWRYEVKIVR
jgi:hypothetical protein